MRLAELEIKKSSLLTTVVGHTPLPPTKLDFSLIIFYLSEQKQPIIKLYTSKKYGHFSELNYFN
jgi:hypothetical protein